MTNLLSVCISVHNTAELLPRCLNSVVQQTLESMEILLVDNGSTDNSFSIMKEFKENYPERNISVIQQEDKGLAQGRQSGINAANGKYITFLDADDYLEKDGYEKLLNCIINTDIDIIEGKSLKGEVVIESPYKGILNTKDVLREYFIHSNIPTVLWLRIYKRELFDYPVLPITYVNNEDNYALPCLLFKASKIMFCDYIFHHYSIDNEHAVMRKLANKKYDESCVITNRLMVLQSLNFIENYIGKANIENLYKNEYYVHFCRTCINFCTYSFTNTSIKKRIKYMCDNLNITKKHFIDLYFKSVLPEDKFGRIAKMFGFHITLYLYELNKKLRGRR